MLLAGIQVFFGQSGFRLENRRNDVLRSPTVAIGHSDVRACT